jgi:hypothetical protein
MKPSLVNSAKTFVVAVLLLSVAACGGGSSGDGGGGGGGGGPTTYTVGGTVSGLSGTGLKIRNNTTDLDVTGNGGFMFPAGLASAATYDVTVVAQPGTPTQVCTVANGSGTVGSSNITTVAVTCTTPTTPVYTVSGTVTGLSGSGLTIRNNTTDLPITANAPFTFATPLASGAAYSVTVVTQPSAPAQVCTVANGSGIVASSDITNVAITCMAGMTLLHSTPAMGGTDLLTNLAPVLTFSVSLDSGTVVNTSTVSLTGPTGAQLVSAAVSGNLLTVTPASPLTRLTPYTLVISTALRGSAGEQLAGPVTINFTTADHGWEGPQRVGTGNGGPAADGEHPQVAFGAAPNAHAVVVWAEQAQLPASSLYSIQASDCFTNETCGTPLTLSTPATSSSSPQIAFNGQNIAYAVWKESGGGSTIQSRTFTGSGWESFNPTSNVIGAIVDHPQVAIDPLTSLPVAVWESASATPDFTGIAESRGLSSTTWTTPPVLLSVGNDPNTLFPQLAFDSTGNALAVWQQYSVADMRWSIWSSRLLAASPPGNTWGTPVPVSIDSGQAVAPGASDLTGHVQIAIDTTGNALAVWQQSVADGTYTNIWSSRLPAGSAAGSPWSTPVMINTPNGHNAELPQIAIDSSGNALVVWDQSDGTNTHIWANRYVAAGAGTWGAAEGIGSNGAVSESQAKIAFAANGQSMAVWTEGHAGIFSNHYTPASGWETAGAIAGASSGAAFPQIAFDADGNAMAVWEQLDSATSDNVWSNRFDIGPVL